jgi:hypothetical protein
MYLMYTISTRVATRSLFARYHDMLLTLPVENKAERDRYTPDPRVWHIRYLI